MDDFAVFIFLLCAGPLLLLFMSIRIVNQNRVKLVERFGKYVRTLESGLNLVVPFFDIVVSDISLALHNMNFEVDTVTKDKVVVRLKANLIYKIDRNSVVEFYYQLQDPRGTIMSFVENYVRSYVSSQTHEELLERREEISEYLISHLDDKFKTWGIVISSFQVMDIVFPKEITDAMNKVVASVRIREAALNEAEAEKVKVVKAAEAEKESRILLGEGVAGERMAIIDGLKASIDDLRNIPDLNANEIMSLVVVSQYFDTVRAVGESNNAKIMFMNPSPEGANSIIEGLSSALEASNHNVTKMVGNSK